MVKKKDTKDCKRSNYVQNAHGFHCHNRYSLSGFLCFSQGTIELKSAHNGDLLCNLIKIELLPLYRQPRVFAPFIRVQLFKIE